MIPVIDSFFCLLSSAFAPGNAADIVRLGREVFGKSNDFCKKITYKTTGEAPKALIAALCNSYRPRIAIIVDMIATGTDTSSSQTSEVLFQSTSRLTSSSFVQQTTT